MSRHREEWELGAHWAHWLKAGPRGGCRRYFFLLLGAGFFVCPGFVLAESASADFPGEAVDGRELTRLSRIEAPVAGGGNAVWLVEDASGREWFWVRRAGPDNDRLLTPAELADLLRTQSVATGWVHRFFNVSSSLGLIWVAVGLGGQVLFAGRMVVQWIVSERSGRSVVPVIFWWISLGGATLLLAYFVWRRDVVGILGQSMGWLIYVRNLFLIYGKGNRVEPG